MYTSETPGGRERRKHHRFQMRKDVLLLVGDEEQDGTLIDISVGGAAIEIRATLEWDRPIEVEIDELGKYPAKFVRRIDENIIAVEFLINEAMAVRLAARIALVYHEAQSTAGVGEELEVIELLPPESSLPS